MDFETRALDLEIALQNLLEFFESGTDGVEVETDDGIVVLGEDFEDAYREACKVLNETEEG